MNFGCSSKRETTLGLWLGVSKLHHVVISEQPEIQDYEFQCIDSVAVICFDLQSKIGINVKGRDPGPEAA